MRNPPEEKTSSGDPEVGLGLLFSDPPAERMSSGDPELELEPV